MVVPTGGNGAVPLPKHATSPSESRIASAPEWAKRIARDDWRFTSEARTKIGRNNKSIHSIIPRMRHATAGGTNGPK